MLDLVGIFFFDLTMIGNDDACVDPQFLQCFRQRADNVGQTAGLRQRCAFGSGDQNVRHLGSAFFAKKILVHFLHRLSSLLSVDNGLWCRPVIYFFFALGLDGV